jgi:exopolysaccharide biosynthesis predicted pyruvyltransferase EpsI
LIHEGARCFFKQTATKITTELSKADVCVYGGGGNLGSFYRNIHLERQRLFRQARQSNIPIVIMPQSVTNKENLDKDIVIFVREKESLKIYPQATLVPDMALAFDKNLHKYYNRSKKELGVFLREDGEKLNHPVESLGDVAVPSSDYWDYIAFAAKYNRIATDRLHFAIAAIMLNKRTILMKNNYHKNKAMYEAWLRDLGCEWMNITHL